MKFYRIYLGAYILFLIYLSFDEFGFNPPFQEPYYQVSLILGIAAGIWLISYNKKKSAYIENNELVIKENKKQIFKVELSGLKIIKGLKSIKLRNNVEERTFKYSDFDDESIRQLKSLI